MDLWWHAEPVHIKLGSVCSVETFQCTHTLAHTHTCVHWRKAGLWGPPWQMLVPGLCLTLSLCGHRQLTCISPPVPAQVALPALHGKQSFSLCRAGMSCGGKLNQVLWAFSSSFLMKSQTKQKQQGHSVTGAPFKGSLEVLPIAASAGRGFPQMQNRETFLKREKKKL